MLLFILKKVILELLNPFSVILILFLIGLFFLWFTKKQKLGKVIVSLGVILIFILGSNSVSNKFVIPLENKYPKYENLEKQVKYIVVLGGGFGYDKKLPIISRLSSASIFRLAESIVIYNKIPGSKLIFTGFGGLKQQKAIAEGMTDAAMALGVSKENIIIESSSKDTREEACAVKGLVKAESFVLVTSAIHMKRAVMLFEKLGMNPIPAPSGFLVKRVNHELINFPSTGNIMKISAALHEYFGLVWYKIRGFI